MTDDGNPLTPVVVFDEFLAAEELRGLIDFTLSRQADFAESGVLTDNGDNYQDFDTRRSLVLLDLGWYYHLFAERLLYFLPHVLIRLGHPAFEVSELEIQVTGTGNGEFFKAHTDSGSSPVAAREITFVYFFHREPRAFAGGELRIYDTEADGHAADVNGGYHVVHPQQNQVVFFRSDRLHEILPVGVPTGDFYDQRFTVNGWFNR
jgi:Rps23 Pro-64 3,4-dihydroxylase Tpa1-like proline 4-hydroxylase